MRDRDGDVEAARGERALARVPHPEVVVVPGGLGTGSCSRTRRCWAGCARRTRTRAGRPRCAPARCCSRRPGSSRALRPRRTGPRATCSTALARGRWPSGSWSAARSSPRRASRPGSTWRCCWPRGWVVTSCAGDPAGDGVRPRAALRLGVGRECAGAPACAGGAGGPRGGRGALSGATPGQPVGTRSVPAPWRSPRADPGGAVAPAPRSYAAAGVVGSGGRSSCVPSW